MELKIAMITLAAMLFLGLPTAGILGERRIWNKGICKKNGKPWAHFDTDSQGGRGYEAGDEICWITWPLIDS